MPLTIVAAALGIGAAVWLLVPSRAAVLEGPRPLRSADVSRDPADPRLRPVTWVTVVGGVVVVFLDGTTLALGLICVGAVAAGWWLVQRAANRRRAQHRADVVVEACEALAGELRAGQPPLTALRRCAEQWPELEPAARAGRLGGDIPTALRRVAALPGASGLADVATAWRISERSGGTMALAVARVAETARRRRATQQLVASELASAHATARLVALLPFAVLAMGAGIGGDPWGFLLTTPAGLTCLAAGVALAFSGLAWLERVSTSAVDV